MPKYADAQVCEYPPERYSTNMGDELSKNK